jgi:hypothetical protein
MHIFDTKQSSSDKNNVFFQTCVKYDIALMHCCIDNAKVHFIVMASNELTSVCEVIIYAEERP